MERLNFVKNENDVTFRWPRICKKCAGYHQSPVCIYTNNVAEKVSYLKFFGIAKVPKRVYIRNTNDVVRMEFKWPTLSPQPPSISGTPLPIGDTYSFVQLHFHWNDKDDNGSEHSVNDILHAMEMHMVFWNTKYTTIGNAINYSDGISVIGFFIKSSPEKNSKPWLIKALKKIRIHNAYTIIKQKDEDIFSILDLIKTDKFNFYSYQGSLTQPVCAECVTWIIAEEPLVLHPNDINEFRKLRNEEKLLIRNCRSLHTLGCRKVFHFVPKDT